jgi:hypothetical protein
MPAVSKAALIAMRVRTWPVGTPPITSNRLIVAVPTPENSDKLAELHLRRALAARIWSLVINANSLCYDPIWIVK